MGEALGLVVGILVFAGVWCAGICWGMEQDNGFLAFLGIIGGLVLAGALGVGVGALVYAPFDPGPNVNKDPRKGAVDTESGEKYCDGPNLIYVSRGVRAVSQTVIQNSPECA